MRGLFLDAVDEMASVFEAVSRPGDPAITVNKQDHVAAADLPRLLAGYDFMLDDHSTLPVEAMRECTGLKHVIFLGTGARSYMNPEALAELGIQVLLGRRNCRTLGLVFDSWGRGFLSSWR